MSDGKDFGTVRIGPWGGGGGDSLHARIEKDQASRLNHLIRLGYDLLEAYDVAIRRIDDTDLRTELLAMQIPHRAHVEALAHCVEALWQTPASHGDFQGVIERGRVILADQRKGELGVIEAMATNENVLHSAYREALDDPGLPPDAKPVIARALEDEAGHRAIYARAIERLVAQ